MSPSASPTPQAYNEQLVRNMVSIWLRAIAEGYLQAGSLGSSPVAWLLADAKLLGYDPAGDKLTIAPGKTEQAEDGMIWWTYVREHGLAHRETRKPLGYRATLPPLLSDLPWPIWTLFEIDETFHEAVDYKTSDDARLELLLSPDLIYWRLLRVLSKLQQLFPYSDALKEEFQHHFSAALDLE